MNGLPHVLRYADENELAGEVSKHLVNSLAQAQAERGTAHLCLCGGRAERMVCGHLAALAHSGSIDPAGLHLWWSSEAFVTTADSSRNSLATLSVLGGALAVPPHRPHALALRRRQRYKLAALLPALLPAKAAQRTVRHRSQQDQIIRHHVACEQIGDLPALFSLRRPAV